MIIINKDILESGKIRESIIYSSYDEYLIAGGKRDKFDMYAKIKEKAKMFESRYIQFVDMWLSGVIYDDDSNIQKRITLERDKSQVFWYILHLWFNRPLRIVSYNRFDLGEFNKL